MTLRTTFATFAAAAFLTASTLSAAPSPAQPKVLIPCALLTPDQIKVVLSSPVVIGKPGAGGADCTWADSKGETRVYVQIKEASDFHDLKNSMQATGRLVPITGLAEDAFYIAGTGSSAALYALKAHRLLLITVDGAGFSRAENEGAEKALTIQILSKF